MNTLRMGRMMSRGRRQAGVQPFEGATSRYLEWDGRGREGHTQQVTGGEGGSWVVTLSRNGIKWVKGFASQFTRYKRQKHPKILNSACLPTPTGFLCLPLPPTVPPSCPCPCHRPAPATALPCVATTPPCVATTPPCVATTPPCLATTLPCVATTKPCVATTLPCVAVYHIK